MNHKSPVKANFDWIAPVYDALAFGVFGHRLQQAQAVFLNQVPAGTSILIIGGGTGWLLEQVLRQCQPKHVVYLDSSARMVALASRRMVRRAVLGSVDFRVGDETAINPTDQFDVLLTPFVLDLFDNQTLETQFIPQLRTGLKPDGLWLVTDFVQTSVWWQKTILWSMIRFFRLTAGINIRQLADWQQILAQSGMIRQQHQQRVGGMVATEVWLNKPQ